MPRSITVICPECGADDTTLFDIGEHSEYVTVECESCSNPYVVYLKIEIEAHPYRIIKADAI